MLNEKEFNQMVDELLELCNPAYKPSQPHKIPVNIVDYESSSEFWFNIVGCYSSAVDDCLSLELSTDNKELTLTVNTQLADPDYSTKSIFGESVNRFVHREFETFPDCATTIESPISRTVLIQQPEKYQLDQITSNLVGGVLIVNIPKIKPPVAPTPKPRTKIEINY